MALLVAHGLDVVQADRALRLDLDAVGRRRSRGGTADVEGTHGELSSRLADRLRRDDAHGLADVDAMATAQVAAVALRADAVAGLARDRRAHHDLIDAHLLEQLDQLLVDQDARLDQHLAGRGHDHVLGDHASENALAQALDHIAAFDDRGDGESVGGAAIDLRDHEVLRHVDQTPREIARVRGLQRRIREALAGAVGRDEVLQYVQAFAEIRGDRRLDDGAVGLRHQAAHAGELADLRRGAAGAGVRHHEDRIERLLTDLVALGVGHLVGAELLHHGLRDLIVGARPDVDDLVVALAVGDQSGSVLLLDLLHLALRGPQDLALALRNNHVVHADGDAGAGRIVEAGVHQLVGEHHGLLETDGAVARVDGRGDGLLGHVLVDRVEGQSLRQDLGQERAPHGRIDHAGVRRRACPWRRARARSGAP